VNPLFTLHIALDNTAMQEPAHVAWALRVVAEKVQQGQAYGVIYDMLGNKIGHFEGDFDDERDSI